MRRAAATVKAVHGGQGGKLAEAPAGTNRRLYTEDNPLGGVDFAAKTKLLARDRRLCPGQGSARAPGHGLAQRQLAGDPDPARRRPSRRRHPPAGAPQRQRGGRGERPHGDRQPRHAAGAPATTSICSPRPGRRPPTRRCARRWSISARCRRRPARWRSCSGPGWPGILLHEAIGHGLEGDFNRKKTSAFAGLLGQRIAAKGVTVVDDGTLPDRRGSLTVDDEGTPTPMHHADRGRHPGRLSCRTARTPGSWA